LHKPLPIRLLSDYLLVWLLIFFNFYPLETTKSVINPAFCRLSPTFLQISGQPSADHQPNMAGGLPIVGLRRGSKEGWDMMVWLSGYITRIRSLNFTGPQPTRLRLTSRAFSGYLVGGRSGVAGLGIMKQPSIPPPGWAVMIRYRTGACVDTGLPP
jgi:hypothetical protein